MDLTTTVLDLTENNPLIRSQAYVNGKWVNAADGLTFGVINPATGEQIAVVTDMGRDDVRAAIDAAHAAWPAYRDLTAKERADLLRKWFVLILEHKEELARLM